ncbi:diaminopimelate decarboxylase [Sphaerisporangium rufum]|uniref:Diaminopimelate decarboxylase n=1 Tax=Sphaerisporangium rufum TaxID=1381558 RepID=A0A919R141_9ACTN|nr:diaminopimelate decarboxylase [Sphaerisporangium rufum]GII76471.1 diaminopimelate decarboxylase [Sphaerisporangium rufum]
MPPPWPDTAEVDPAGDLRLAGVSLGAVAEEHGTPVYVLDAATFVRRAGAYRDALAAHHAGPSEVHYAGKAYLSVAVAQLALREGLHLDAVSVGEVRVGRHAGVPGDRIHLHGNAKTAAELREARRLGVGTVIVDSLDELRTLAELARDGVPQAVMLRLSPGVAADTHPHISTGHAGSKFGIPLSLLPDAARLLAAAPALRYVGLHCHIGSQITDLRPYRAAVRVLLDAAGDLRRWHGWTTRTLSPGGGLGIAATAGEPEPAIEAHVQAVAAEVAAGCERRGLPQPKLVLEPGRSIVGPAMVALYRVVAAKPLDARDGEATAYLHLDGGMGDNVRPAMYGARLAALPVSGTCRPHRLVAHLSGRYCESGDILARDVHLPEVRAGEVLAVPAAGAYTLSMASSYNHVPRPPVVLVFDGHARLVTRRESHDDLIARDAALPEPLAAGLPVPGGPRR